MTEKAVTDTHPPRLLVIDDNTSIHEDFKKILIPNEKTELSELSDAFFEVENNKFKFPKYVIDFASQGQEGLDLVKKQGDYPYSVAFIDIRMPPGWDGIETISQIWKVDPRIQMVICTAYSDYTWEETINQLGANDALIILKKPFDIIEVRQIAFSFVQKWKFNENTRNKVKKLSELAAERSEKLDHSLALLRTTMEAIGDGILVSDNNGEIIDYNTKFVEMHHISEDILKNSTLDDVTKNIAEKINNPDDFIKRTMGICKKEYLESFDEMHFQDGKVFERYSLPHYVRNKIVGRVWNYRDITKFSKMEASLKRHEKFDLLTDLPNREFLQEGFNKSIETAKKFNGIIAILFLNLDRVKIINDSLGRDIGDLLLKAAARRLSSSISEKDIISRIGGDEFVFLITSHNSLSEIIVTINKILNSIRKPFQINEHELLLTGSIGFSICPSDGTELNDLLKKANAAMCYTKKSGRNNFQQYTDQILIESQNKITLENDLRKAINNKELILLYQPMIDILNNKITGVEALIRWKHPILGLLPAVEFIPVAEESDLILSIGEWVLFEACRQNKAWQDRGLKPIIISVNLSAMQFKKQKIDELIVDILKQTQLSAKYLALEITESVIIGNTESALVVMNQLKKLGVSLCIDDFGTGYSSLSYLKMFPFDTLKIDRSFIKDLDHNIDDKKIVQAIISMAKSLNLNVIAEGTEEIKQLNYLKGIKCDQSQGFLFSQPVTADLIENMLKQQIDSEKKNG